MLLAGVVLSGVVLSGAVLGGCSDPGSTEALGGRSTTAGSQQSAADPILERDGALSAVLRERATAIRARDRRRFVSTLDTTTSGFGARQLEVFASMSVLGFGSFAYGPPEPAPALSDDRAAAVGPDAVVVRVRGRYTLAGYDRSDREFETYLTFVHRAGGWRIADDTDGDTQPQLWDLPGLRAVRSTTTLVAGNAPETTMRAYLALGEKAVRRVGRVWPRPWGDRLVLVAPATRAQMAVQLGQEADTVGQVAAVTDGSAGVDGQMGSDRIVVNPEAFGRLRTEGRQVVIAHEATHVAVRRTTSAPVPTWLSEGLADYVGYGAVDVSRSVVARQLLSRVRRGQGPTELPGAAAFDPGQSTIAPSYNAAYLAVGRLVDRFGEARVAALYVSAATRRRPALEEDVQLARAFRTVLGTTVSAVTADWLAYLERLAG